MERVKGILSTLLEPDKERIETLQKVDLAPLDHSWLRGLDSNQEYPLPKSGVLPLNDPAI